MNRLISFVLVLLLFSACDELPLFSSDGDKSPLHLKLDITSENIETLQDIRAEFTVTNFSNEKVTYSFSSSCQHGYTIERIQLTTKTIVDSRQVIGCLAVITSLELEPDESKQYPISLGAMSGKDSLASGNYQINAFLLENHSSEVSETFVVE